MREIEGCYQTGRPRGVHIPPETQVIGDHQTLGDIWKNLRTIASEEYSTFALSVSRDVLHTAKSQADRFQDLVRRTGYFAHDELLNLTVTSIGYPQRYSGSS